MKKMIGVVLLITCMVLAGCGSNASSNSLVDTPKEESTEPPTIEEVESSFEEASTNELMDEASFISLLENEIRPALGGRDKINNISLSEKHLVIEISLENNFRIIDRFSGITDHLLSLKEAYNLWDSVTVDFGSLGYIQKTKNDITIDGAHFNVAESDIIK